MRVIHVKGVHFSVPPIFMLYKLPTTIYWQGEFNESCKYHIDGEDMYDWNKLCGLKALFFKPMFDTVMIAWRYSKEKDCFQLMPYFHIGSKNHTFDEATLINVPVNTQFKITLRVIEDIAYVKIYCKEESSIVSKALSKKYSYLWVVNSWFGGQSNSPKNMKIFINRNKLS